MRNKLIWTVAAFGLLGLTPLARAEDEVCVQAAVVGTAKKVCVMSPEKKTITHTCWDESCEDFCIPCWRILNCLFGTNCCGKLCVRKDLIIKVRKEDRCCPKCVPVYKMNPPGSCPGGSPPGCETAIPITVVPLSQ